MSLRIGYVSDDKKTDVYSVKTTLLPEDSYTCYIVLDAEQVEALKAAGKENTYCETNAQLTFDVNSEIFVILPEEGYSAPVLSSSFEPEYCTGTITKTFTLSRDEEVCWRLYDETELVNEFTITWSPATAATVSTDQVVLTVSTKPNVTTVGEHSFTVQNFEDGETWTANEFLLFEVEASSSTDTEDNGNSQSHGANSSKTVFENMSDTAKNNFATQAVMAKIDEKVKELLGDKAVNFPFYSELPSGSVSSEAAKKVTADELASAISKGCSGKRRSFDIAPLTFPTVKVTVAGTYPLGAVPTTNLTKGMKLYIYMLVVDSDGNVNLGGTDFFNMKIAEDSTEGAFFVNDNGEVITEVPESLDVNIIAPLKANIEYTPVVALSEENDSSGTSGSGGGCEIRFGLSALMLMSAAAILRKKNYGNL